jgi:hypothetical protein
MGNVWGVAGLCLAAGLALGIVVTRNLHGNPHKQFWNVRLGRTSLRRANLPVGGALGAIVAAALYAAGRHTPAVAVAGLALGMALGAIGVGIFDPLPRKP